MSHPVPGHAFCMQSILACTPVIILLPPTSKSTSVCLTCEIILECTNISLLLTAQLWALSIVSTEVRGRTFLSWFFGLLSLLLGGMLQVQSCLLSYRFFGTGQLAHLLHPCVTKDLKTQQLLSSRFPRALNCTLGVKEDSPKLGFQFDPASLTLEPIITQFFRVLGYTFQKPTTLTN